MADLCKRRRATAPAHLTALRGVVIEPGRQTVEFVFIPSTFNRLLRVSGVGLAGLVLVSLAPWAGRWKDRRSAA